jgi:clan AA aspartic protease
MGEVRVKVKLTNATDEALARRGKIETEEIRVYEADAMVETGAVQTVIPADVVKNLGLETPRQRGVEYAADGRKEVVPVTEAIVIEIRNRATNDEALVLGDEVLIGQTVLEKLDLHVDCANRQVIPNPAHPDQAVTKVK